MSQMDKESALLQWGGQRVTHGYWQFCTSSQVTWAFPVAPVTKTDIQTKNPQDKMFPYSCCSSYRNFNRLRVCSNYHQKNVLVQHWKTKIKAAYLLQIHVSHIKSSWSTDCFWLLCFAISCMFALQQKLYNAFGAKCMAGVRMCSAQQRAS